MRPNPLERRRFQSAFLLLAAVSACAGPRLDGAGRAARYRGLECAPYARELTGIALYGDAADWWDEASGHYARASTPVIGAALVFRRSARLASGHVSVVSNIVGQRQILVMQANWVPGELDEDQLVVDVSELNDWTAVRVWYPPSGQLGAHTYEAYGFILPPAAATHDELARASRDAAVTAIGARLGRPAPRARSAGG
jgi:surface antigen